eukprot:CAMPEP_0197536660 /NCGR_PEP_ID=MMETSP1318-20131121/54507_1 /TAXON_ID=552666 /ORGANISM="Partenskyella glossopodia, Strain RCC365" /LENGTH=352 /DNA_ID=CAMNT_0043094609 /DNA_START=42 /DNA_END=1100 /DNA_ORIENTATION=+
MNVSIFEGDGSGFDSPEGYQIWSGALVGTWFLSIFPNLVKGKSVLDLGSGTGISGISAAAAGASRVKLVDNDKTVLSLMQKNIKYFRGKIQESAAIINSNGVSNGTNEHTVVPQIEPLIVDIGDLESKDSDVYDVVLASEVLYTAPTLKKEFPILLNKIKPGGLLIFSCAKYDGINEVLQNLKHQGTLAMMLDISLLTACSTEIMHRCRSSVILAVFKRHEDDGKTTSKPRPVHYREEFPEDVTAPLKDECCFPSRNMPDIIHRLWRLAIQDPSEGCLNPNPVRFVSLPEDSNSEDRGFENAKAADPEMFGMIKDLFMNGLPPGGFGGDLVGDEDPDAKNLPDAFNKSMQIK